ncbi:MAG: T9SS type A sorting domain-containing protein [Bacteroidetes bacterium]|nr:T9SS type A sorting domain-containing protein [Bacteroidota bacterium]
MRKVYTLLMAVLGVTAALAQAPNSLPENAIRNMAEELDYLNTKEVKPMLSKKIEVEVYDWYRFVDDWRALSGSFREQNSFFSIFPDTFVKNITLDENTNLATTSYPGWCALGQMLDVNDPNWSDPNIAGVGGWYPYSIDSVIFTYGYFRTSGPDVVDTLIVQFYNESQITDGSFTNTGSVFGIVGYDQTKGLGANYTEIVKVPLTEMDSVALTDDGTFFAKNLKVGPENILEVPKDGACAVTVIFKPGTKYEAGDTAYFDPALTGFGVTPPVKKFNRFGLLAATQTPTFTPLQSQNNGLFIVRWNRYDDAFSGGSAFMNDKFYPNLFGNGTEQFGYYPYIGFKIKANYDTGLEEGQLVNGNGLGEVFPNPANTGDRVSLGFALGQAGKVNISVYDITGKKVITLANGNYAEGSHSLTFQASELNPGMYIYTMTTNGFTNSKKFNVVK